MAKADGSIIIEVKLDTSGAEKALNGLNKETDKVADAFDDVKDASKDAEKAAFSFRDAVKANVLSNAIVSGFGKSSLPALCDFYPVQLLRCRSYRFPDLRLSLGCSPMTLRIIIYSKHIFNRQTHQIYSNHIVHFIYSIYIFIGDILKEKWRLIWATNIQTRKKRHL